MGEIPAPLPLIQQKYSLEPDMIFGWKPKVTKTSPIPLDFNLNPLPSCKDSPDDKFPIIYHGYRPKNSHTMHKFFSCTSSYNYLFNSAIKLDIEYNYKYCKGKGSRFIGMKPEFANEIEFDSFFESGNLDKVIKINKNEFDLYIRSDTNTYGNYKWFNFKIINKTEPRVIKLNIVNFKEEHSLFNQGQKPVVKVNKNNWEYLSNPVIYKLSKLNKNVKKGIYYQLSFEISLKENTLYHIATTIPYTLSDLHQFVDSLPAHIHLGSLGKSLSGISIPLLTITNNLISNNNKKYIIVQARQHPSETVSSVLMQQFITFLISNCNETKKLLDKYIFKIIPMVNIDGVIIGNARMSFAGDDLNRKFAEPNKMLHPEIIEIKRLVEDCKNEQQVFMFIDIHGHSKKKGSFMYGPYFPLHTNTYENIRLLPKLISEKSPIFRFYSCRFKSEKHLRQSARLVMSQELGINYTYTMENSLFGYIDSERQTHSFKTEDFKELAKILVKSIHKFSNSINKKNKHKTKLKEEKSLNNIIETDKDHKSSSESDSQSESEEDCLEAKDNVMKAIKQFKKITIHKNLTPHMSKIKSTSNKRIKSQNQFIGVTKNLPVVNKKQMIISKFASLDKQTARNVYHSSTNIVNKGVSLNDTIEHDESSVFPNIDLQNKSLQKIKLGVQKAKYSKINVFDMFTNRKAENLMENPQYKYKRSFNFPAFFSKPMKNI